MANRTFFEYDLIDKPGKYEITYYREEAAFNAGMNTGVYNEVIIHEDNTLTTIRREVNVPSWVKYL